MPSNSILHYLYKRNHTWWFRKRFVSEGNAIEYRLSLHTASFQHARLARNTRHLLEVSDENTDTGFDNCTIALRIRSSHGIIFGGPSH